MNISSKAISYSKPYGFRANSLITSGRLCLMILLMAGCESERKVSPQASLPDVDLNETSDAALPENQHNISSEGGSVGTDGAKESGSASESGVSDDQPELSKSSVSLNLKLSGIKSNSGTIRVAVFSSSDGFPDHRKATFTQSFALATETISKEEITLQLDPLDAGIYSIAVYHDLDDSNQLNKALIGYPLEPYGFSRNARSLTGPPAFSKARIQVSSAESEFAIRLQ